jgi:hypothetical protein
VDARLSFVIAVTWMASRSMPSDVMSGELGEEEKTRMFAIRLGRAAWTGETVPEANKQLNIQTKASRIVINPFLIVVCLLA